MESPVDFPDSSPSLATDARGVRMRTEAAVNSSGVVFGQGAMGMGY